ncbi:septum site-determining protein MinC, partial [Salmonella enterica subsp. enterica serovar Dublin]|nr:septum site-determining protein MinC [Salmonella enterica subsp. enterica serovar Dublin]
MAVDSLGTARSSFDLKSAQLPVMAVAVRDTQVNVIAQDLAQRLANDPDFFDNDPVLIDLQHVQDSTDAIDFPKLIKLLKKHRTVPVAVCNGS